MEAQQQSCSTHAVWYRLCTGQRKHELIAFAAKGESLPWYGSAPRSAWCTGVVLACMVTLANQRCYNLFLPLEGSPVHVSHFLYWRQKKCQKSVCVWECVRRGSSIIRCYICCGGNLWCILGGWGVCVCVCSLGGGVGVWWWWLGCRYRLYTILNPTLLIVFLTPSKLCGAIPQIFTNAN